MTEPDSAQMVKHQTMTLLSAVRELDDISSLWCLVEPARPLQDGELSFSRGGEIVVPYMALGEMSNSLRGYDLEVVLAAGLTESQDCKFSLRIPNGTQTSKTKYTTPWYVDLYIEAHGVADDAKSVLRSFVECVPEPGQQHVFRGEPRLYPEVVSSLARCWMTDSAEALAAIEERALLGARRYIPDARSVDDLTISALIRHLGGNVNLVDFSDSIWVAAFFACLEDKEPRGKRNAGRVYRMDLSNLPSDIGVHRMPGSMDDGPRWGPQGSVMVSPPTGTVPPYVLEEVAKVPSVAKRELSDFLSHIGIAAHTMFNDIGGYISYEADRLPMDAFSHMIIRWIEKGNIHQAYRFARSLTNNVDEMNRATGYYWLGICHAWEGEVKKAAASIQCAIEHHHQIAGAEYACANVAVLEEWLSIRTSGRIPKKNPEALERLRKDLTLDFDSTLWTFTLSEYTVAER